MRARKIGRIVCLTGESVGHYDIGGGKWVNLTTIPEAMRPTKRTEVPVNLGNVSAGVRSYLEETGEFYFNCTASSCTHWGCSVTYVV